MQIPKEDDNTSKHFGFYKDKKSTIKKQYIEKCYRNLVNKSLNIESYVKNSLSKHTFSNKLLASILLSFLKKIKFSEYEFPNSKPILDIKYYYLDS